MVQAAYIYIANTVHPQSRALQELKVNQFYTSCIRRRHGMSNLYCIVFSNVTARYCVNWQKLGLNGKDLGHMLQGNDISTLTAIKFSPSPRPVHNFMPWI